MQIQELQADLLTRDAEACVPHPSTPSPYDVNHDWQIRERDNELRIEKARTISITQKNAALQSLLLKKQSQLDKVCHVT